MKLVIALMLTFSTIANAADDAPIMFEPTPDYVCIYKEQRLNEGKAIKRCLDTNESLTKGNVVLPTAGFVAITVGAVVLSAVITGIVVANVKK